MMKSLLQPLVRGGLSRLGIDLIRSGPQSDMYLLQKLVPLRDHLLGLDPEVRPFLQFCATRVDQSHSQMLQDLFVLYILDDKRGGYFVDFGATDGVELSNSYLLEKSYGWRGVVAEPARDWHGQLKANRGCSIEFDCVSDRSGESIVFNETPGLGLSTMEAFSASDRHADARQQGRRYEVTTISLNDMLVRHGAPNPIDYLSIDTEGSELSILSTFDLERYRPKVITVEHNFIDDRRGAIFDLLSKAGYRRRFEQLSMFDDWYVL